MLTLSYRNLRWAVLSISIAMLFSTIAFAQTKGEASRLQITSVPSTPIDGEFSFAAVGDLIYLRPMLATLEKQAPEMLRILRNSDVAFANFETTAIDLDTFAGAPQAESGGTWMLADPAVPKDVAAMGFDMVGHANNHSTDWGVEGMMDTLDLLEAAELIYAGTGRNMTEARATKYLDIAGGRVGLISAATSFTAMSPASDALGRVPGRPGANTIRRSEIGLVSRSDLAVIARLVNRTEGEPVKMNGREYRASEAPVMSMKVEYELKEKDVRANLLSVRQGKQNGNFLVYTLHNHEPGNAFETPANFAQNFAREVIDAGADVFVGHGPHRLRGIEIYKGKPIFYSLGNFAMMNNSLDDLPADMYDQYGIEPGTITAPELLQARAREYFSDRDLFESVIAVSHFRDGDLSEVRLHPIDLGVAATGAARGVPQMADAVTGSRILARLQRLSRPYGTKIDVVNGVGIIRIGGKK